MIFISGFALAHYAAALPYAKIAKPAQQFSLPFVQAPGPSTWLLGQAYGNTIAAYRRRNLDYRAGQGIHFGLDFIAPCGTVVVAIADGVVAEVDGPHGSPPHNVVVNHAGNLSSLYGHLLKRSNLKIGQAIRKSEPIGFSGDSRLNCYSAPHLHLEIRDASHQRFLNPVRYINADWNSLLLVAGMGRNFQRDFFHPRRWQNLTEQPDAIRGGRLLNDFAYSWPADNQKSFRYPATIKNLLGSFSGTDLDLKLLPGDVWQVYPEGCCLNPFWSSNSQNIYFLDGGSNHAFGMYQLGLGGKQIPQRVFFVPFNFSPSQNMAVLPGRRLAIERLRDNKRIVLPGENQNNLVFSANETSIAWLAAELNAKFFNQFERAPAQLMTANLNNNQTSFEVKNLKTQIKFFGASLVGWLNEAEIVLVAKRKPEQTTRELFILNVRSGKLRTLLSAPNFRSVSIAPGGAAYRFSSVVLSAK